MTDNEGGASERQELSLTGIILSSEGDIKEAVTEEDLGQLAFRDIVALVLPAVAGAAEVEPPEILAHHRALERVMKEQSVLPAAPGLLFSDRSMVAAFLEERYLAIKEAFDAVSGRWELRLHLRADEALLDEVGPAIYRELRQRAHLSMTLRRNDPQIYSAAFLIDRTTTRLFRSRVDELAAENREADFELTGPWPPYDFVMINA